MKITFEKKLVIRFFNLIITISFKLRQKVFTLGARTDLAGWKKKGGAVYTAFSILL